MGRSPPVEKHCTELDNISELIVKANYRNDVSKVIFSQIDFFKHMCVFPFCFDLRLTDDFSNQKVPFHNLIFSLSADKTIAALRRVT